MANKTFPNKSMLLYLAFLSSSCCSVCWLLWFFCMQRKCSLLMLLLGATIVYSVHHIFMQWIYDECSVFSFLCMKMKMKIDNFFSLVFLEYCNLFSFKYHIVLHFLHVWFVIVAISFQSLAYSYETNVQKKNTHAKNYSMRHHVG